MNLLWKDYLKEFIVVNLFLLNISLASISSYVFSSFIVKVVGTILLYCAVFFLLKPSEVTSVFPQGLVKKVLFFILILSLSLIYSLNPVFGIWKLSYLLISTIPCVFVFYYLYTTNNPERNKVFLITIISLGVIFAVAVTIIRPFEFYSTYTFSPLKWSHQIYGRIIAVFFLLLFFTLIKTKNVKLKWVLTAVEVIILYSLFLAGGRSVLFGVVLVTLSVILFFLIKGELTKVTIVCILLFLITSSALMLLIPPEIHILNRYENLTGVEDLHFMGDKQISERFVAYDISIKRIKEEPVLGIGLGGFRTYYSSDLPLWMKYPHNIFLEYAVELGIPGVLLLLYMLYMIFYNSFKASFLTGMFFVFALSTALFSKDLATQVLLYCGIIFTEVKESKNSSYLP